MPPSSVVQEENNGKDTPWTITELPKVVDVPDQPCQQLYEANPVLLGYDVVQYHFIPAYRDGGVAVRGKPEFAYNFNGYQFWFSSKKNRDLFIGDPWKYAPAFGGFCAYGIGFELPPRWPWEADYLGPPASPWEGWLIIDGTLMFNIWASYSDLYLTLKNNTLRSAMQWKKMFGGKVEAGPFNTHCIGHGVLKNYCLSQQPSPWLSPLPQCNISTAANTTSTTAVDKCLAQASNSGLVSEECKGLVIVNKGGVVSKVDDFDEFTNQSISPYAKKAIQISLAVGIPLLALIAIVTWVVCRRRHFFKAGMAVEENDDEDIIIKAVSSSTSSSSSSDDKNAKQEQASVMPTDIAMA